MNRQEKGFSFVEIILVVAVVVLLGFVGWRVWEAKKETGNNGQNTQQQNQQANEQKQDELNPDGYLHIKELGIKMKLPQEIKDAEYSLGGINTEYSHAFVYTKSIADKSNGTCDPSLTSNVSPFGGIYKTTKNIDGLGNPLIADNERVFKLSNSYIFLRDPQSPCTTDSEVEELILSQRKQFLEALKSIELDQ